MIVAIGEVTISLLGVIVTLQSRGGSKLLLLDELEVLFCNDGDDGDDGDDDAMDVDAVVLDDKEGI